MGERLSQEDLRLYRLCDEALFYLWDPIGVRHMPYARDEYESYLPETFRLVKQGSRRVLVKYLLSVTKKQITLVPDRDATEAAADFMLESRDMIASEGESE